MPIIYEVQCARWDRINYFTSPEKLTKGEKVVIKNDQWHDLVTVLGEMNVTEEDMEKKYSDIDDITRKADAEDLERYEERISHKEEDLAYCRDLIEKRELKMKLVDVFYSLDGGRMTFAFVSEERVDFRSLVRDLTSHYHKSLRLQQLGARDAARYLGDIGACGVVEQCCRTNLKELPAISMEMAEIQQVANRGSDRISGMCGRLKCCLMYELETYQAHAKKMPRHGDIIMVKASKSRGQVVSLNLLQKRMRVKVDGIDSWQEYGIDEVIIEPKIKKEKKKA